MSNQRKIVFANNVRKLLAYQNLTRIEAAKKWGMDYHTLNRWSSGGVAHVHPHTRDQMGLLSNQFGFDGSLERLWSPWEPTANDSASDLMADLVSRFRNLPMPEKRKLMSALDEFVSERQLILEKSREHQTELDYFQRKQLEEPIPAAYISDLEED